MKSTALILSCEHASRHVPARYRPLFTKAQRVLQTHRAYDIGAFECARHFANGLQVPLISGKATRLLADCNRSEHNPTLWSAYTRHLAPAEKNKILNAIYYPYRSAILNLAQRDIRRTGHVLHLSIHSFTPRLNGQVRHLDIGLLYDPGRRAERQFALKWRQALKTHPLKLRVRCNAPYKGVSDGMIPFLRKQLPVQCYTGLEIEINQRYPLGKRATWRQIQRALLETFIDQVSPPR